MGNYAIFKLAFPELFIGTFQIQFYVQVLIYLRDFILQRLFL